MNRYGGWAVALLLIGMIDGAVAQTTNGYSYDVNADDTNSIAITGGPSGALTIPTNINGFTVTGIGFGAFVNDDWIVSVTIPQTVTNIGASAFAASTLTNLIILGNMTDIGTSVFTDCLELADAEILSNVGGDCESMFEHCVTERIKCSH